MEDQLMLNSLDPVKKEKKMLLKARLLEEVVVEEAAASVEEEEEVEGDSEAVSLLVLPLLLLEKKELELLLSEEEEAEEVAEEEEEVEETPDLRLMREIPFLPPLQSLLPIFPLNWMMLLLLNSSPRAESKLRLLTLSENPMDKARDSVLLTSKLKVIKRRPWDLRNSRLMDDFWLSELL